MFNPKTRILVLDDMMTMRKMVTKICKELGFSDITEAADGSIGWESLQNSNPPFELIISDWNMPNCSGLELLKKVRGDDRFKKIPFVMVTAEAEKTQIMEAIQSGVNNYVIKPFTSDILQEKLKAVYDKIGK